MVSMARAAATDETGLVGHIAQVLFVSDAPWGADGEGWLVDLGTRAVSLNWLGLTRCGHGFLLSVGSGLLNLGIRTINLDRLIFFIVAWCPLPLISNRLRRSAQFLPYLNPLLCLWPLTRTPSRCRRLFVHFSEALLVEGREDVGAVVIGVGSEGRQVAFEHGEGD